MQRRNKSHDERQNLLSEHDRSVTDGVEFEDLQYQTEKSRPPYGTILIAAFFFIAGTVNIYKIATHSKFINILNMFFVVLPYIQCNDIY